MPHVRRQRGAASSFTRSLTISATLCWIGAKVIGHGRSVAFQMAEVVISRQMFRGILRLIAELRQIAAACASIRPAPDHASEST
jgi:hypothetical protein